MSTRNGLGFSALIGAILASGMTTALRTASPYPQLSKPRPLYRRSRSKYATHYGTQAAARNLRHLAAGTHGL